MKDLDKAAREQSLPEVEVLLPQIQGKMFLHRCDLLIEDLENQPSGINRRMQEILVRLYEKRCDSYSYDSENDVN